MWIENKCCFPFIFTLYIHYIVQTMDTKATAACVNKYITSTFSPGSITMCPYNKMC